MYDVDQAADRHRSQIEQIHILDSKSVEFNAVRDENGTSFGHIPDGDLDMKRDKVKVE